MRIASLLAVALCALPARAHDGHAHGPLEGPLHHLAAPAVIVALCAIAAAVAYWRSRRK